jgi:hypothetical protein
VLSFGHASAAANVTFPLRHKTRGTKISANLQVSFQGPRLTFPPKLLAENRTTAFEANAAVGMAV